LIEYQKKAFQNLIFQTDTDYTFLLGLDYIDPLRMPIKITKRVEKGKMADPEKTFLGIPQGYMDNVTDIFTYEKAADPVEIDFYNDGETFEDKEEYKFEMNLDLDFSVQAFTYSYFTTLDALAAIGGLGNAIKIGLGALVPFLTLRFMVEFSSIH
jgi:hypothetical protein